MSGGADRAADLDDDLPGRRVVVAAAEQGDVGRRLERQGVAAGARDAELLDAAGPDLLGPRLDGLLAGVAVAGVGVLLPLAAQRELVAAGGDPVAQPAAVLEVAGVGPGGRPRVGERVGGPGRPPVRRAAGAGGHFKLEAAGRDYGGGPVASRVRRA